MYVGFHSSHITRKNQLTFPSKLKTLTGRKLFIAPWFEQSLIILPEEEAQQVLDKILQGSVSLYPEVRDLESILYVNAETVELDIRNRFVLGKRLREYARIQKEAVFLGIKDRIELWDKEIYTNYAQIREKQIRDTAINLYNRITANKNT